MSTINQETNKISNDKLKHIIHVNKHIVKSNRVYGRKDPVITVKNYKVQHNTYGVDIFWQGHKVCSVVHQPDKPLACGAVAWVEVPSGVKVEYTPAPKPVFSKEETCAKGCKVKRKVKKK